MALTYTQTEVLEAAHARFMDGFFTALPGIVVSYDPAKQVADVQPAVKNRYTDEEGDIVVDDEPIVPHVPVMFPGSGGASITWPVAKGDPVLLIVSSLPIGTWIQLGGVVDPREFWRNHLGDCVAIPGLRPLPKAIKPAPLGDALVVSGPTGGKVKLGASTGTSKVVVQSALDDFTDALGDAISALTILGDPSVSALEALRDALGALNGSDGWLAGTTKTEAA